MAKIYNSIFGIISGKHGNAVAVVAANGTNYIRIHNPKRKDAKTEKQIAQRAKFSFSATALLPFNNLFKETMGGSNGLSAGRKYAFRNAIAGEYPNFSVDYDKLMLSFGTVDNPANITTDSSEDGYILSWDFVEGLNSRANDKINVIIYNEKTRLIIHKKELANRSDLSVDFEIPAEWAGTDVHIWAYLTQGNSSSNSILVDSFSI